ncbi:hypothetical protein [Chamaesiphon sp. VAR_69_metabat_338]|uniref:hypothetical protein n=1 Tax=Chamaesiphon sp. VAR_69_metabat_338 TaxID=2964704 RepID=UPI00286DCC09|nr:hypothetical protein [Chamaesiphon sp. VAR_69_metabat_338]
MNLININCLSSQSLDRLGGALRDRPSAAGHIKYCAICLKALLGTSNVVTA